MSTNIRGCLLVGSVPLANNEDVFRQCLAGMPSRLKRLPDGETGNRSMFTLWQSAVFQAGQFITQPTGNMADITAHFRFMDLLMELRLMVYDSLSVLVTHHRFEQGALTPAKTVHPTISKLEHNFCQLVWETLEGISLLTTCRQINRETSAIIQQKLTEINLEPVRIIATASALKSDHLARMIIPHVSSLSVPSNAEQDLKALLQVAKPSKIESNPSELDTRDKSECHIYIAIALTGKELAMTNTQRLRHVEDSVTKFHRSIYITGLDIPPRRLTRVQIQLALISPEDKAMQDLHYTFDAAKAETYKSIFECATKLRMGGVIDEEVWKKSWALEWA